MANIRAYALMDTRAALRRADGAPYAEEGRQAQGICRGCGVYPSTRSTRSI